MTDEKQNMAESDMSEVEAEPVIRSSDVELMAEQMLQDAQKAASVAEANRPIRIDYESAGHEGEYVDFVQRGWKFRDLVEYEEALGSRATSVVVCRKIVDWHFLDELGKQVPFKPKAIRIKIAAAADQKEKERLERQLEKAYEEAMFDLPPDTAAFVWAAYRAAYNLAGALGPNR